MDVDNYGPGSRSMDPYSNPGKRARGRAVATCAAPTPYPSPSALVPDNSRPGVPLSTPPHIPGLGSRVAVVAPRGSPSVGPISSQPAAPSTLLGAGPALVCLPELPPAAAPPEAGIASAATPQNRGAGGWPSDLNQAAVVPTLDRLPQQHQCVGLSSSRQLRKSG